MKNYENLISYEDGKFKRLVGVKKQTFETLLTFLKEEENKKKAEGGAPNKLKLETRLLMALEYLREYRTYAHIGEDYGISESACYTGIQDPNAIFQKPEEIYKYIVFVIIKKKINIQNIV